MQSARAGAESDGFQRRQQIGNEAAANNDLVGCAHKIDKKLLFGAPAVLDVARVRENWFLFSVITISPYETGPKLSTGYFLAFWLNPDGVGRWQGPKKRLKAEG
jgi:hypothetical protein